jgi:branched-chain amino acid transport system permease protein
VLQIGAVRIASFQGDALIVYGAFLVVAGLVFSDGAAGLVRTGWSWVRVRRGWVVRPATLSGVPSASAASAAELPPLGGERLAVDRISKVFGGLRALDDVTLEAAPGEVTALIGPNGSGKTTLLNLVCGFYRPSSGRVLLGEARIDALRPYRTARAGVARTFQTPLVPKSMTTKTFVATGRYVSRRVGVVGTVLRTPGYLRRVRSNEDQARKILEGLGIGELADADVSALPLGTRRLAEVARCLAAEPRVFLFDEVGSGLDEGDLDRLQSAIELIRGAGGTVVLVEHNFPLVLRLADRIHVLSNGALVASGTPEEIQSDPRVLEEYTGASAGASVGASTVAGLAAQGPKA